MSEAGGSTFWKATDEILARPVAVLTFDPGFPRVHDVVTAARAASRLNDPRLTQVFDADDSGEHAYVVSEWVTGETLEDLLVEGPMEPDRAAAFLLEAAEAIGSAHGAGLAHLCLTPHNLVWTSGGTVKVTGLGVEAVLSGTTSETPALEDTCGLGNMLYAALTGHWSGAEGTQLPAAPAGPDGRPLPPHRLQAGVPRDLDAIACRALQLAQEPLSTPSEFAEALSHVPRSPLPFLPLTGSTPPAVVPRPEPQNQTASMQSPSETAMRTMPDDVQSRRTSPHNQPSRGGPPRDHRPSHHSSDDGPSISKGLIAAITVGVLVLAALGIWGLTQLGGEGGPKNANAGGKKSSAPVAPQAKTLKPVHAHVYNPPPHADTTAPNDTDKAIDDSPSSYWTTQYYFDAEYGRQRKGIGLVLDMGKTVTIDKVTVTMPAGSPGKVVLYVGDNGTPGSDVKSGSGPAVGTFSIDGGRHRGQYITLWFAKLPNVGNFQAKVKNVAVQGSE